MEAIGRRPQRAPDCAPIQYEAVTTLRNVGWLDANTAPDSLSRHLVAGLLKTNKALNGQLGALLFITGSVLRVSG